MFQHCYKLEEDGEKMKKTLLFFTVAFLLVGLVSCDTFRRYTITVSLDRHPVLIIVNATGQPIDLSSPVPGSLAHGARAMFSIPSLDAGAKQVNVEYRIGGFSFGNQVAVTSDMTVTLTERPPVATVINNTGFPITITSPSRHVLSNGGRIVLPKQSPTANQLSVTYAVDASQFQFSEQVTINDDDVTLTLTRRPPRVTVVNGTGHTIQVAGRGPLSNGGNFSFFKQSATANPVHAFTYTVGISQMPFTEQVSVTTSDVTLNLTRRPPNITIANRTGVTIHNVFIRNSAGSPPWGAVNILGLQLNPDGTVARMGTPPGTLVGSITNGDNFRFWTGHLEGHINPATFDVRLDDTHGVSYVMNNVSFGNDITLTFTQAHRP